MPYIRPIPKAKRRGPAGGSSGQDQGGLGGADLIGAWVQAEKMIQIALVLPCAGFIGWLMGAGLDRVFHATWISMAGILLGIIAGLVGAVRMAMAYSAGSKMEGKDKDGTGAGGAS